MFEILQYQFIQNALLAGFLAAVVCGVVGTLVVVNRVVFLSGGIAHAAYGGVGLALFAGFSPLLGAGLFALGTAAAISVVSRARRQRIDTIIGVLWAVGMALGILFVELTPGYAPDLMSYLFGSILAVSGGDLVLIAVSAVVIIGLLALYFRDFLAMSYDEEYAKLRGVRVEWLHFLLLALIALSIVVVIRVVGLILVIALLTIAPYLAETFSRSLRGMMVWSVVLNVLFMMAGLGVSVALNLTSGAAIILVAGTVFLAVVGIRSLR